MKQIYLHKSLIKDMAKPMKCAQNKKTEFVKNQILDTYIFENYSFMSYRNNFYIFQLH